MTPAEKERRLTRLYAVSSGINDAIVRIPEESRLFEEACRIAVERGGLKMAWVALAREGSDALAVAAWWGHNAGYLDTIEVTTSTRRPEGQGPAGVAFRTGEPAVCNDIESDRRYFASRGEALSRGYRSCAAFPLKVQGRPIGVFIVYAGEPMYFDDEDLALLTALADNFAFAIDSRRRARALRESESRLRAVIDNEPQCVATISTDATVLEMNPAGLRTLQADSPAQVLGQPVSAFVHPDDRAAYAELLASVGAGSSRNAQLRALGLKGAVRWLDLHLVPLRSDDGAITSVLSVSNDVTQERAGLQQLQHKAGLLAIAGRLGQIGGWEVSLPQLEVTWTDELCAMHGVPRGYQPTLEQALSFYVPEHRAVIEEAFRTCSARGTPFDVEVDLVTSTGRRMQGRSIGEAVRDESGRIYRVQGAFQDISERKKARQEIVELNAQLEQRVRERTAQLELANHELGAFSYSVAHDLRAPLAAISGFSQALEQELAAGETASERSRHYLARMRAGLTQTHEMIDAMLALSQLSQAELRWKDVDLAVMARTTYENLRRQEPGRAVELRLAPTLPARGDPRLLQLVLDNLVGNAWKFTGGAAHAQITVGSETGPGGETVFFVRDNGVGFDMDYAGKLFGAFQRLHSQAEFPGTGVGLANVWRIVTRHGGRVWATAVPGQGANFSFTLGELPPA